MSQQAIWDKLLKLKPTIPRHAHIQQRYYGDELWYILNDKSSGQFHRFNEVAYLLIGFMDGRKNLDQILDAASKVAASKDLGVAPEKADLITLLQYLYVADLLVCDFTPSTEEMFNRKKRKKDMFWSQLLKSPYVWKFSVFNPDKLLDRMLPLARIIASPTMGIVWLILVIYGCLQVGNHWQELSKNSFNHILSPQNLFLLWLIYPVLKVFHELGHGLFTKVWGGNVNEFGVVFILGTPLPYVDATAATAFSKTQRLMVGAAGMSVEIFFAALSFIIWINITDGLLRDICFNIMLIGGVSTLFFNGNPLMKFDGYHILCDAIDQPNLASRASQQVRYFIRRYGYNVDGVVAASEKFSEAFGLVTYSILSFFYRLMVLVSIVVIVSRNFPTVGVALGLWLVFFQLIIPLAKYCIYLFVSKDLIDHRVRAVIAFSSVFVVAGILLFVVPVPYRTSVQGVVWLPQTAKIQVETSGEVVEYLVSDGDVLTEGQPIIRLSNADLQSELLRKKAYLLEYQARYEQTWSLDQSKTRMFEQDISVIQSEIQYLQAQVNNLVVRCPSSGVFKSVFHHQLEGSYVKRGDTIGLIANNELTRIRVAVTQQEIGIIKKDTTGVEVRLASHPTLTLKANISQEVPKATYVLPSPALGTGGGGRIIVDSTAEGGSTAIDRIFVVDVTLAENGLSENLYGMRTHVAFNHTPKVMFDQVLQSMSQAFINITRNN